MYKEEEDTNYTDLNAVLERHFDRSLAAGAGRLAKQGLGHPYQHMVLHPEMMNGLRIPEDQLWVMPHIQVHGYEIRGRSRSTLGDVLQCAEGAQGRTATFLYFLKSIGALTLHPVSVAS